MTTDVKFRPGRPPRPPDSFTLSTASKEEEKEPAIQPKSLKTDSYSMYLGLSPQQLAEQDCLTNLRQNANISPELREKLCKIINGGLIDTGNNDEKKTKDSIKDLMHLWFKDNVVIEEIYDTLRRNGLHITEQIILNVSPLEDRLRPYVDQGFLKAEKDEIYMYYLWDHKHPLGAEGMRVFVPEVFKETQINQYLLSNQLFAIPFGIESHIWGGHRNMLLVRQYQDAQYDKPVIKVEHFEPHGQFFDAGLDAARNKEQSDFIVNRVFELIQLLFDPAKYKIIVLNPNQICPTVELQGLTSKEWGGSCEIFSLWYMLLRLLNPSRSRSETYHLMNNFLKSSHSANEVIRQIYATFTSLITVDMTTVNGTPLMPGTRERLEQTMFPDGVFPTEGGRMNPPKPMRKKKKFKTVKKRNKKTIKIINRKRNKTKIKRKCMYSKLG